jgi:hypothetical protein
VHTSVDNRVHLRLYEDGFEPTLDSYFSWIEGQDGLQMLSSVGLSIQEAETWHWELAVDAQIADPLEHFRILLRHASRSKRERLQGRALYAHSLYDAAEIHRRYLEQYHDRQLLEEEGARHGPRASIVKHNSYGSPRTGDFNRTVFRRIARDFDVDPQARTTWFLEGETERAFVEQFALREHIDLGLAGIEIMNLEGVGGLNDNRFRALLERFQREEVFAYVSIDREDGGKHLRLLKKYAADKLLPAGFRVWRPDFESANFTLAELADVATKLASANGVYVAISARGIQQEMRHTSRPAGEAIKQLWRYGKFYGGKGWAWGKALADWAIDHPCPAEIANNEGERPIIALVSLLLTGQQSHYQSTAQEYDVDSEGNLVERTK